MFNLLSTVSGSTFPVASTTDAAVNATGEVVNQAASAPVSNGLVVLMGVGTVFAGLICIIIICRLLSLFCGFGGKEEKSEQPAAAPVRSSAPAQIPNRQEMVAAISAVLAEELGADVSAIRIHSIRPL